MKRVLSFLLVICLVFSSAGVPTQRVLAADTGDALSAADFPEAEEVPEKIRSAEGSAVSDEADESVTEKSSNSEGTTVQEKNDSVNADVSDKSAASDAAGKSAASADDGVSSKEAASKTEDHSNKTTAGNASAEDSPKNAGPSGTSAADTSSEGIGDFTGESTEFSQGSTKSPENSVTSSGTEVSEKSEDTERTETPEGTEGSETLAETEDAETLEESAESESPEEIEIQDAYTPEEFAGMAPAPKGERPVTIEGGSGKVHEKDSSHSATLRGTFHHMKKKDADRLTKGSAKENAKAITEYLEEENLYCVKREGTEVSVSFPYSTRRIMVFREDVPHTYGADSGVYYHPLNYTLLSYPSEEATRDAYEQLRLEYGEENVLLSLPVFAESYEESTDSTSQSWGADFMHLDRVRDQMNEMSWSTPVTVAVLDSGVRSTHEQLRGRISSMSTSFTHPGSYEDKDGHGTHTAGIIAECTPDNVELLIIQILDDENLSCDLANFLNGISYACHCQADIINLSLTFSLQDYDSDTAYWYCRNTIDRHCQNLAYCIDDYGSDYCNYVCAAGNRAMDLSKTLSYPAAGSPSPP